MPFTSGPQLGTIGAQGATCPGLPSKKPMSSSVSADMVEYQPNMRWSQRRQVVIHIRLLTEVDEHYA
jgi:hypothetical protein